MIYVLGYGNMFRTVSFFDGVLKCSLQLISLFSCNENYKIFNQIFQDHIHNATMKTEVGCRISGNVLK